MMRTIQITDKNLIEILRDTMPVATTNKKGLKGTDEYFERGFSLDTNDAIYKGSYTVYSGTANNPVGGYGVLEVTVSGIYIIQHIYALNSDVIYMRRRPGNVNFSPWLKVHG